MSGATTAIVALALAVYAAAATVALIRALRWGSSRWHGRNL
jgi:hypothetical protein